jgi:hypothetical protein
MPSQFGQHPIGNMKIEWFFANRTYSVARSGNNTANLEPFEAININHIANNRPAFPAVDHMLSIDALMLL